MQLLIETWISSSWWHCRCLQDRLFPGSSTCCLLLPWTNGADTCAALIELSQKLSLRMRLPLTFFFVCQWCLLVVLPPAYSISLGFSGFPQRLTPVMSSVQLLVVASGSPLLPANPPSLPMFFPIHSSISHSITGTLTGLKWPCLLACMTYKMASSNGSKS